jgi:hypothetical protein
MGTLNTPAQNDTEDTLIRVSTGSQTPTTDPEMLRLAALHWSQNARVEHGGEGIESAEIDTDGSVLLRLSGISGDVVKSVIRNVQNNNFDANLVEAV